MARARRQRWECCWAWCGATRGQFAAPAAPRRTKPRRLQDVSGIIEEPRLYPYLSGRANLELLSDLDMGRSSRRRVEEVLETVELRDRAKDRVGEYSQGMRQRLGIASCLVRNPKLMML